MRAMRSAIDDSAANLRETTDEIGPLWNLLMSKRQQPSEGEVATALASSGARLQQLRQRRQEIVGRLIAPRRNEKPWAAQQVLHPTPAVACAPTGARTRSAHSARVSTDPLGRFRMNATQNRC